MITEFDLALRGSRQGVYTSDPILRLPLPRKLSRHTVGLQCRHLEHRTSLIEGRGPFGDQNLPPEVYMARLISLLGPPPLDVVARRTTHIELFDDSGKFRYMELVQGGLSLRKYFTVKADENEVSLLV